MIELIKKNSFLFVGGALLWFSWSAITEDTSGETETENARPSIVADLLAVRDEEAEALAPDDPFQMAEIIARMAAEQEAEYGEEGDEAADEPEEQEVDLAESGANGEARVVLESVLCAGGLRSAVLNGQRYRVGDALADLDPFSPPTVVEIEGRIVKLRYRDRTFFLDVVSRREISLTEEPQ